MKIEKTLRLKAPIDRVWEAVMDVQSVASCMPGAEKLEQIDDRSYRCSLTTKIAYISATFDLKTTITAMEPPHHLGTVTDGTALMGLGRVSQKQTLDLVACSNDETEAIFNAEVTLVGRLATFGDKLFRAKANEMMDTFIRAFLGKFEALSAGGPCPPRDPQLGA
ncbi:MAG: hypothetical protein HYX92_20540 [Chloroflexi bacterium]|nr:hypothetical protein [Chloroflexota bacterium]